MRPLAPLALLVLVAGCTTLGPTPALTGIAPVPAGRPELDLQAAALPGHFLSAGATQDPKGAAVQALTLLVDPGRLLLPGLFFAARGVGGGAGGFIEPLIGYRTALTDRFSGAIIAYGTHASGEDKGASFSATRAGAEVDADVRVTDTSRWVELHVAWGVALTGLSGDGRYCADEKGYGIDCPATAATPVGVVASGAYVTGNASLVAELLRHRESWFHGGRVALGVAGGTMPTYRSGAQGAAAVYASVGLTLSLAIGAER